ncbi:MAG: hypothetical protein HY778_06635 [Betaproteobacteria bacterium]|nr:hypothetical protein [Betaproteobacteria bacterium]
MAVFRTEAEQNLFINQLKEVYKANEAPSQDQYYRFSNAGKGQSGYRFGQAQFDVRTNADARSFLTGLKNASGEREFTDSDIRKLAKQSQSSTQEIDALGAKLARHVSEVDRLFEAKLREDVGLIENIVAELRTSGDAKQAGTADYIANNRFAQLLIADFNNQFHINGVDSGGKSAKDGLTMEYLKGGRVSLTGGKVDIGVISTPQTGLTTRSGRSTQ